MPERARSTHLVVTGANGYIGSRLVERALAQGRSVTVLGRSPGPAGTRHLPWRLGEPFPAGLLSGPSDEAALVHLAHDWSAAGGADPNIAGTILLFEGATRAGFGRRVFVSSQSARAGALNRYGRTKWAIEQAIGDAVSLRVGLVYGGPRRAMYGLLCRITALGPVLPMVDPHRAVQPIHRDEVVQGILAAADGAFAGPMGLAGPVPVPFGSVLRTLAQSLSGRRLRILPVPLRLALLACDLTRIVPLLPTVDRERVLGLAGTEPLETSADLARLGVAVRPMAGRLAAEPAGRRARLAEAKALLTYAVGRAPTGAVMRRYARATPDGAVARPLLLRWCEPLRATGPLAERLRLASRLAEASAPGEAALGGGTRIGRLARLSAALALDAAALPTRLLATLAAR